MNRKTVIVLTREIQDGIIQQTNTECFGSLRKACNKHDWVYNTLVQKKLPIVKDGWLIERVKFE